MNERSARRLARLADTLAQGGSLRLADAAALCGVSEMTIRRDLAAGDGELTLMGGHLVRAGDPRYAPVYDLDDQRDRQAAAKRRLCRRAVERVEEGDTLFIDCGTTLMPLVAELANFRELTVVTYALNVANAVARLPHLRLVLLGGVYHASSQSFGDEAVDAAIARLGINRAFLSAAGLHPRHGLSCFHFHEVAPKRAAIATAGERILVADATKLGVIRPARFAELEEVDLLVTDAREGDMEGLQGPRVLHG
ncbi:DeoR/GlpR family DNA-binding transcription regulator [Halomonas ramblicola]|uniref:DeoR/GlpR family DNA-binding transcription regulator n=1 Tax=Halomonas ramblicola TaxID=747349 RepID=UPI0025B3BB79|nr:DeoR/GlpR family DNA-binding transcription regulator [Halomonas ramblicola]MDN3520121.1 DeoR/GlpR family DNA-binding transcription regulator [Halomonas ramblicola]